MTTPSKSPQKKLAMKNKTVKRVKAEICTECGQLIDHEVKLRFIAKRLRKEGRPNVAKLLLLAYQIKAPRGAKK